MSISIQTNTTSLFAEQALSQNSTLESQAIQQLSSGYRINPPEMMRQVWPSPTNIDPPSRSCSKAF